MHVAAADAGVVYGEKDIVGRLEGRLGFFFERDVEGFVEDEGEVLWAVVSNGCSMVGLRLVTYGLGFCFCHFGLHQLSQLKIKNISGLSMSSKEKFGGIKRSLEAIAG